MRFSKIRKQWKAKIIFYKITKLQVNYFGIFELWDFKHCLIRFD